MAMRLEKTKLPPEEGKSFKRTEEAPQDVQALGAGGKIPSLFRE